MSRGGYSQSVPILTGSHDAPNAGEHVHWGVGAAGSTYLLGGDKIQVYICTLGFG